MEEPGGIQSRRKFSSSFRSRPSARRWGQLPHVDRDVEERAPGAADELPLRGLDLGVEAAQGAAAGAGVVVLDEVEIEAALLGPAGAVEDLEEEAALVAVDVGLDEHHAGQGGGREPHRASSASSRCRYRPYSDWARAAASRASSSAESQP